MSVSLRVLLVKGSEADAAVLLHELRGGGYDPVWERVDSPEGLAAALDGKTWDIVIADYVLPWFDGLAALLLVKERQPNLPVILVAGAVDDAIAAAAMHLGARDFLSERDLERLLAAIERELRRTTSLGSGRASPGRGPSAPPLARQPGRLPRLGNTPFGRSYVQWAILLGFAVALFVYTFFILVTQSEESMRRRFEDLAKERTKAVQDEVNEYVNVLWLLNGFVSSSGTLAADEIRAFQEELKGLVLTAMAQRPSIQEYVGISRVALPGRAAFEAIRSQHVMPGFQVMERAPSGQLVRASERDEYYVKADAAPLEKGLATLGLDMATIPEYQEVMERARDSGQMAAAAAFTTATDAGRAPGIMVFAPVYHQGSPQGTVEERRHPANALAALLIDVGALVDLSIGRLRDKGIDLYLIEDVAAGRRLLHHHGSLATIEGLSLLAGAAGSRFGMTYSETFDVAGQHWIMEAYPTAAFFADQSRPEFWVVLGLGALLMALTGVFFVSNLRGRTRIEALVVERTAKLSEEIVERRRAEEAVQRANAQLISRVHEIGQRNREMALLSEMADMIQGCVAVEESYAVVARCAGQLFPDESGALYAITPSRNLLEASTVWGEPPPKEQVFEPDECWALRRGQPYKVEDPSSGVFCQHVGTRSPYLCVPMIAQGETMGLLHLRRNGHGSGAAPDPCGEAKQQLAAAVASQVALAVANLKLRETLRFQAIRDPLTRLLNRRYMEEALERDTYKARRDGSKLAVIMLDIDHFKTVNDTYGHEAGDAVLHELGSLLETHFRGGDIACRYGGEEFVLIMPGASLEGARERAEELRKDAQLLRVKHGQETIGPATISLGVAVFPDHGSTRDAVLEAADAAMYRAKQSGRNRVETA